LFTHLPEERFRAWLAALAQRLAPLGVLAFSTHDPSLLPPAALQGRQGSGCLFEPHSEIAALDTADYGSTWVDERFVREALAATGLPFAAARFPRALCNYQDLWVAVADPAETFAGLALRAEPEVMVERCAVESGELVLRGWAHARYGGVARLEAWLDGSLLGEAPVEMHREDLGALLGPEAAHGGWELRRALPAGASANGSVLVLRAVDAAGRRQPVWAGSPQALSLQARSLQARELEAALHRMHGELAAHRTWAAQELATLQARIAAMEASRFWKLRNAWFAAKRALRLTDER
jgi:hypothetical protein